MKMKKGGHFFFKNHKMKIVIIEFDFLKNQNKIKDEFIRVFAG